jgi:hypothetical protein
VDSWEKTIDPDWFAKPTSPRTSGPSCSRAKPPLLTRVPLPHARPFPDTPLHLVAGPALTPALPRPALTPALPRLSAICARPCRVRPRPVSRVCRSCPSSACTPPRSPAAPPAPARHRLLGPPVPVPPIPTPALFRHARAARTRSCALLLQRPALRRTHPSVLAPRSALRRRRAPLLGPLAAARRAPRIA